jgi:hypothetical protein
MLLKVGIRPSPPRVIVYRHARPPVYRSGHHMRLRLFSGKIRANHPRLLTAE